MVECKHRKEFRTSHLFHPTEKVKGYHAQVLLAAGRDPFHRSPLLVMRGSDMETYASALLVDLARWAQVQGGRDVLPVLHYECMGNIWSALPWERFLALVAEQSEILDKADNLDRLTLSSGCVFKDLDVPCEDPHSQICPIIDPDDFGGTCTPAYRKPVKEADAEPRNKQSKLLKER